MPSSCPEILGKRKRLAYWRGRPRAHELSCALPMPVLARPGSGPMCDCALSRGYRPRLQRAVTAHHSPITYRHPIHCSGDGRGCGVGRGLGVALGVAVGIGVAVGVPVGVGVTLGLGVGVTVTVAVAVGVGV